MSPVEIFVEGDDSDVEELYRWLLEALDGVDVHVTVGARSGNSLSWIESLTAVVSSVSGIASLAVSIIAWRENKVRTARPNGQPAPSVRITVGDRGSVQIESDEEVAIEEIKSLLQMDPKPENQDVSEDSGQ